MYEKSALADALINIHFFHYGRVALLPFDISVAFLLVDDFFVASVEFAPHGIDTVLRLGAVRAVIESFILSRIIALDLAVIKADGVCAIAIRVDVFSVAALESLF